MPSNTVRQQRAVVQVMTFLAVGVAATSADWLTFFVLTHAAQVEKLPGKALSFVAGILVSYTLNRRFTFQSRNTNVSAEAARFLAVSVVGIGLNTAIFWLTAVRLGLGDLIGLVLATAIVTVWNFTSHKYWTFRQIPAGNYRED